MIKHFVVRVGDWKFENWHLYQLRVHRARKHPKHTWVMWDLVF